MQQQSLESVENLDRLAEIDDESSVELLVSQGSEWSDSSLEAPKKSKDTKARKMLSPLRKKRYVPWDLHSAELEEANEKFE